MEIRNEDSLENKKTTVSFEIPSVESISSKRPLIPFLFGLVLFFFFFNFFTVTCSKEELMSVTGVNLVIGKKLKNTDFFNQNREDIKVSPNFYAVVSFAAAFAGLALFLSFRKKNESFYAAILGGVGSLSLFILRSSQTSSVAKQLGDSNLDMVQVKTNASYWLALLAMIAVTAISVLRVKKEKSNPSQIEEEI